MCAVSALLDTVKLFAMTKAEPAGKCTSSVRTGLKCTTLDGQSQLGQRKSGCMLQPCLGKATLAHDADGLVHASRLGAAVSLAHARQLCHLPLLEIETCAMHVTQSARMPG